MNGELPYKPHFPNEKLFPFRFSSTTRTRTNDAVRIQFRRNTQTDRPTKSHPTVEKRFRMLMVGVWMWNRRSRSNGYISFRFAEEKIFFIAWSQSPSSSVNSSRVTTTSFFVSFPYPEHRPGFLQLWPLFHIHTVSTSCARGKEWKINSAVCTTLFIRYWGQSLLLDTRQHQEQQIIIQILINSVVVRIVNNCSRLWQLYETNNIANFVQLSQWFSCPCWFSQFNSSSATFF